MGSLKILRVGEVMSFTRVIILITAVVWRFCLRRLTFKFRDRHTSKYWKMTANTQPLRYRFKRVIHI